MAVASLGFASMLITHDEQAAVLWTQETGIVSLQDLLVDDYGLGEPLEGWRLDRAIDITDDGRFIAGRGSTQTGSLRDFWSTYPRTCQATSTPMVNLTLSTSTSYLTLFEKALTRSDLT